jgi:hypothetical protein
MLFSTNLSGTPISLEQIKLIEEMYPYDASNYPRLRAGLNSVLTQYPHKKLGQRNQVLALSQHNGRGQLWTVVLVNLEDAYGTPHWILAGHQGHRGNIPLTREQIESGYIAFKENKYWMSAKKERDGMRRKGMIALRSLVVPFVLLVVGTPIFFGPFNWLETIGVFTLIFTPFYAGVCWADNLINPKQDTLALNEKDEWDRSKYTLRLALSV